MIWCVEKDGAARNIQVYALESAGFHAKGFENGTSFWEALQTEKPELVLLDTALPGMDGVELLKRIRMSGTVGSLPVIMATGNTEYDIVRCLDAGADDCVSKPFGMMEMVSRVRAVLRRHQPKEPDNVLRAGNIAVYLNERAAAADGQKVNLSYKEFELLRLFMEHPGEVFTREQLYTKIWKAEYTGKNRTVDIHVQTLRKKLGTCGSLIESVRYIGYRMKKVL